MPKNNMRSGIRAFSEVSAEASETFSLRKNGIINSYMSKRSELSRDRTRTILPSKPTEFSLMRYRFYTMELFNLLSA